MPAQNFSNIRTVNCCYEELLYNRVQSSDVLAEELEGNRRISKRGTDTIMNN